MPLYELVWSETTTNTAYVRATSESAARQAWIDGDFDSVPNGIVDTNHLIAVSEMPGPHDRLCCCPICEGAL